MNDDRYYVMDGRGYRVDIGMDATPFPPSTFDECMSAINYYAEADYPDWPYSIVNVSSDEVLAECTVDDDGEVRVEYLMEEGIPPKKLPS